MTSLINAKSLMTITNYYFWNSKSVKIESDRKGPLQKGTSSESSAGIKNLVPGILWTKLYFGDCKLRKKGSLVYTKGCTWRNPQLGERTMDYCWKVSPPSLCVLNVWRYKADLMILEGRAAILLTLKNVDSFKTSLLNIQIFWKAGGCSVSTSHDSFKSFLSEMKSLYQLVNLTWA